MKDPVWEFVMRQVAVQEAALEVFAISGCFVDDMWIVIRSRFPMVWEVGVGDPVWRTAYAYSI